MDKQDVGNLLIGLGIGLVVGAAVGILIAPKSGVDTRQIIRDKVSGVVDKVGEKVRTTIDKVHRS